MRRVIALGMSFVMVSGCSFALVSGPPDNHRQLPAFECTTSRVGPILDTVWTALQALNLGLALSYDDSDWDEIYSGNPPVSRKTGIGVYSVFAALGAAGMWFGYTRTSACRNAKTELATRAMQPGMPNNGMQTWPPPPATPTAPPPATPTAPPPATPTAPPPTGTPPTLPPPPAPTL
jgi:hypothetical protein